MNAVKTVKKVQHETRKDLGIREIKGSNKMAFVLDGTLKRQIVFKPV